MGYRLSLEGCLAYAPWAGKKQAVAYAKAVAEYYVPPFIDPEHAHTYDDPRMVYLYHLFRASDIVGDMKEIEFQWKWLAGLCTASKES
jgi:hypothetical protein